ncbi:MAG TPA: hypothetical protein VFO36_02920, partial [Nitrospiraceae bacterium]|nr:hypothetical protein [Nitrospiraceae bacterium]
MTLSLSWTESLYDNKRTDSMKEMRFLRRTILKATGLGALSAVTGGCDAVGGVFGRMFAVPPRD